MLKWLKRRIGAYARRYFDRQMRNLIDTGEYEAALRHATDICQRRENDISAHHWRAVSLLWLERYDEALEIANRIDGLKAAGVMKLEDSWVVAFEETKCCAFNGMKQFDVLHNYASECLQRHPGTISLASYLLRATIHLGRLTTSTPCLHALDGSINEFDEAWEYYVLHSAQIQLGNEKRASEIARLALAKFPSDAGIQEMAKSRHDTVESLLPCVRSHDRHCRPR